jgi:hypothetical protein
MGIVDIKLNKINTNFAISCLDSSIRIYDIDTSTNFVIQDNAIPFNVKLWKTGKFSILVIILLPVGIAVGLLFMILYPRKKLGKWILVTFSLPPWLNPIIRSFCPQLITTETCIYLIYV